MIGSLFCFVWAHYWHFMFTNADDRAVFYCSRCTKVKVDTS